MPTDREVGRLGWSVRGLKGDQRGVNRHPFANGTLENDLERVRAGIVRVRRCCWNARDLHSADHEPAMRAVVHEPRRRTIVERRQWLQALGQTPRLIALLWEPLAVAALNQPIDSAAAASFATVIDRILESRAASSLGLAVAPPQERRSLCHSRRCHHR